MSEAYRHNFRHHPPSMPRRILGWLVVAAGVAMLVLPGPGLLALALGVILLGRRDPLLRRCAVFLRLMLRRLSRAERRLVRRMGCWLRAHHVRARKLVREQVHRHARGEPLSLWVRVWIGMTIVSAAAGLGLGLLLLF